MSMIRDEIKKNLENAVTKSLKIKVEDIHVEHPDEKAHGDYSTNVAIVLSKKIKKDPMGIAEIIESKIKNQKSKIFEKIEIAEPGFINFFLSKEYLQKQVKEILKQGEKFGQLKIGKNEKVQVEFISANPTGPLTVGNARGGAFGDVLGNVLKKAGFKAEKAYYINDYGMQILTLGHSVLKDSQAKYKGDYIDYLHKKVKEEDPYKAGEKAAKIIVEEMIKKTTDKMGITYDEWISETNLHQSGAVDKVLEFLKKKDLIYQKEGALWFKASKFDDERDRVVVKKDGWKTYLAGDFALHQYKFQKKKFDKVINIWGADHVGDVAGLQAGVEAIGHKGKLDVILLQFVTLFEKGEKLRMSKRMGAFVTMDELLNKVGSDVTRFFFLQRSADTHLNFDLSLAKEQSEKNPVYYIQYAHARICSILRKAASSKQKATSPKSLISCPWSLLEDPSELNLIKQLIRFPEIIEDTTKDYQIQRLPQYAIDLATSFHRFYRDCRVLSDYNPPTASSRFAGPSVRPMARARLVLISATKQVIKNTLNLMGISAPEKM